MTRDQIFDRLIASDRTCGRQKRRTGRMLQCLLATWPGAKSMGEPKHSKQWKDWAVSDYRAKYQDSRRVQKDFGISPALLMLLAEIIIKALIYWWQNREITTADLARLHFQA